MAQFNLKGNVTFVETKQSKSGGFFSKIGVACDTYKGQEKVNTSFFTVTVFNAEGVAWARGLSVGDLIQASGVMQSGKYTDRDGNERTSFDLIAWEASTIVSKAEAQVEPEVVVAATPTKPKKSKGKKAA